MLEIEKILSIRTDTEFNEAALRTFEFQREANPVYRRFCDLEETPQRLSDWREIPALPVSAFKAGVVTAFPPSKTHHIFRTSGTTRGERRGEHRFATLEYYDAVIDALFRKVVLPDRETISIFSLIPSLAECPDSSLSYWAARIKKRFGSDRRKGPVLVLSTTLALDQYLQGLARKKKTLRLSDGSRVVETGGSKGRVLSVSRPALLRRIRALLGIPAYRVINEYGMTELTTHFYDRDGVKTVPLWARVRLVDPRTGREARAGRRGIVRIFDLANQGSCLAIQTEDEGRWVDGGFEILGRKEGADLRGCSLTFEEMEKSGHILFLT